MPFLLCPWLISEADPECWISSTDVRQSEIVEMSCTVVYRGTWTPVMKWQRSDGKDVTGIMHSSSDNSGIRFTYTAAVEATDSLNGMHFQCVTNFDQQNSDTFTSDCSCDLCTYQLPLTICATGAPTYTYIWSSRPLSVSGKPACYNFNLIHFNVILNNFNLQNSTPWCAPGFDRWYQPLSYRYFLLITIK